MCIVLLFFRKKHLSIHLDVCCGISVTANRTHNVHCTVNHYIRFSESQCSTFGQGASESWMSHALALTERLQIWHHLLILQRKILFAKYALYCGWPLHRPTHRTTMMTPTYILKLPTLISRKFLLLEKEIVFKQGFRADFVEKNDGKISRNWQYDRQATCFSTLISSKRLHMGPITD